MKLTFFAIDLPESGNGGIKYIHGQEILDFCWSCLRTTERIDTCSREYNFEMWGEYKEIVLYFKKERISDPGNIKDLYSHFKL